MDGWVGKGVRALLEHGGACRQMESFGTHPSRGGV